MKIELPESQKEITLGQFQEYSKLIERKDLSDREFLNRKIKIFTGLNYNQVSNIELKDVKEISDQIDKALNEESKFNNRFKIGSVEFGFIPNLDKIKAKEFFDLSEYSTDSDSLHKLMAILFRPIDKKDLTGNYTIIDYQGTKEWADIMKKMPLSVVQGSLGFFLSLSEELKIYITKSTLLQIAKETRQSSTLKNGGGTQQSTE